MNKVRLAKAKEEDAQEAAKRKREDETRYARYRNERQRALAEKSTLENEWQDYVELYNCCARWADFRNSCNLVCEGTRLYNEIDRIEYLACSSIPHQGETPDSFLCRCYNSILRLQEHLEEKEKGYYFIIND